MRRRTVLVWMTVIEEAKKNSTEALSGYNRNIDPNAFGHMKLSKFPTATVEATTNATKTTF